MSSLAKAIMLPEGGGIILTDLQYDTLLQGGTMTIMIVGGEPEVTLTLTDKKSQVESPKARRGTGGGSRAEGASGRGGRGAPPGGRGGRGQGPTTQSPQTKKPKSPIYDDVQLNAVMPRYSRRIKEMVDLGLNHNLPVMQEDSSYGELASSLAAVFSSETASALLSKESKWKKFVRTYHGLKAIVAFENDPPPQRGRRLSGGSQSTSEGSSSSVQEGQQTDPPQNAAAVPVGPKSDETPTSGLAGQEKAGKVLGAKAS